MNPTNDRLVDITDAELAAILNHRRIRGLPPTYPATSPEVGKLTPAGRCWWIAELVLAANMLEALGTRDAADAERLRELAHSIAAEVAKERALIGQADDLRAVADALDGKHAAPEPETPFQRVLRAAGDYCATHGHRPTQKQLKSFAPKLRAEDICETFRTVRLFPVGKPGRKPSN